MLSIRCRSSRPIPAHVPAGVQTACYCRNMSPDGDMSRDRLRVLPVLECGLPVACSLSTSFSNCLLVTGFNALEKNPPTRRLFLYRVAISISFVPRLWVVKTVLQRIPARTIKTNLQKWDSLLFPRIYWNSAEFRFSFSCTVYRGRPFYFHLRALPARRRCQKTVFRGPRSTGGPCALRPARLGCPTDAGTEKRRADGPPFVLLVSTELIATDPRLWL